MTSVYRISLPALLTAALLASPLRATEQKDIDKAVDNGVAYLKGIQGRDGSWRYNADDSGALVGATALGALTLLECDVPPDDKHIQAAAKLVREGSVSLTHTYSISLSILFLDRLGEKEDVPLIESLALRLLAGQDRVGGWTYQCPTPAPGDLTRLRTIMKEKEQNKDRKKDKPDADDDKPLRDRRGPTGKHDSHLSPKDIEAQIAAMQRGRGALEAQLPGGGPAPIAMGMSDNSNTQFAILALWVARRHELPVDEALARVEARFRKTQNADGGWSYRTMLGGGLAEGGPFSDSTPSMTCAGLLGLAAGYGASATTLKTADPKKTKEKKDKDATEAPAKKEPAPRDLNKDAHIKAGLKALGASGLGTPAAKGQRPSLPPALARGGLQRSLFYTLWSVERVAVAYDLETIGNKNWYLWGSEVIVALQKADGSWAADFGSSVDTSFALLFLRRANLAPDLTTVLTGRVHDPDGKAPPKKDEELTKTNPKEEPTPKPEPKPPETVQEKPVTPKPVPPANAETEAIRMAQDLTQANPAKQERALNGLRDGKGPDYTQALLKAIPKLDGDTKKKARDALAERMSRMTSATLSDRLQDDDAEMRRASVLAVAMKEETAHIPRLIELLDDSEMSVSRAAYAALKSLSGKDFGPAKDASRADRADAVAAWKKWWKEKGGK